MASVGEEYEPISDDELDEILADSQKKEDQQDEEKITGTKTVFFIEELWKCCIFFYGGIMEMFSYMYMYILLYFRALLFIRGT